MMTKSKPNLHTVWKGCFLILLIFSAFIGIFLAYYSTFFSYYYATDGSPLYMIGDSWKMNLLVFAGAIVLTILAEYILRKIPRHQEQVSLCFLVVCCVLFFIAGCFWTIQLPYYPEGDQLNTTAAAKYFLEGNYSMLQKGGYIGIYPQQKGLVFLYEILFILFGPYCYNVVEKLHVFSGVIVMIFGFLFLKNASDRCIYRFIYCLCVLFCSTYMILMPYAYGDIPSICFCVVMFWALQRYGLTMQKRYLIVVGVMAVMALFTRQNSWIVLIAVAIGFCLLALEKRNVRPIIAGACIIIVAALSVKLLSISYEIRSGYEDTIGTPASLYFAMGMQESETGPGTYNRFNQGTYESVDFDRNAASELGWIEVKNRLQAFSENPQSAVTFFKTKVQLQWLEPLFDTLRLTKSFSEEEPLPDWINEIYYGKYHDKLFGFANGYQSIVYLAFLGHVLFLFKEIWHRNKRNRTTGVSSPQCTQDTLQGIPNSTQCASNSMQLVPLISLIGGFLFSIIWEAQCRYVLPYYMFMLVYVPSGLCNVCDLIKRLVEKIFFSQKKTQAPHSPQNESSAA